MLTVLFSANLCAQNLTSDDLLKAKIAKNEAHSGIPAKYLKEARISNLYKDAKTGIEHIYLQQVYRGIEVYNRIVSLAFKNDTLLYASGSFIKAIEQKSNNTTPSLSAQDAVLKAAAHLHLASLIRNLEPKLNSLVAENKIVFSAAGIAKRDIETRLCYTTDSIGNLHLTWNVNIDVINKPDWWNVRVDVVSGNIVEKDNWTVYENDNADKKFMNEANKKASASSNINREDYKFMAPPPSVNSATYNVIPYPAENKNIAGFTNVTSPWLNAGAGNNAATYGWQYDGATDYTFTRGNNVYAYDDSAHKNRPGRPASSVTPLPDLQFTTQPNFTKQPVDSMNRTAAVINLFYWNNLMHDVMYQYGFDEAAGNFQASNLSRGGNGNDYVLAEAQDGSGTNNANFSTPPDGSSGRMQMYLWPGTPNLTINTPSSIAGKYMSVESAFSTRNQLYNIGTVTGTVVYYSRIDTLGCSALPVTNDSVQGKIALIYRGTCTFAAKVKNAQDAGAIAVIVVSNSGAPISMGPSGTAIDTLITIPAVMVSTGDGALFASAIRAGNTETATLAPGIALDGDLDNSIITHEYGHGVSTRLTGGPANVSCLYNAEQAGEGWSDYQALMMTTNWATAQLTDGSKLRPVGTYAVGQSADGSGIRRYPYTTNININPLTYTDVADDPEVHAIGEVWCAALWDMTWNIIQQEGRIEGNLYNATGVGGNTISLQLVMEGMKLQPCQPGFLDARNAILTADSILYGYRHKCAIWNAFARRGMGVSAIQGSANNASDQIAAFDAPGVTLAKTTEPVVTSDQFTETLTATCGCAVPAGNYSLTDSLAANFTYVSSTGGSYANSTITFPLIFTAPLQVKTFSITLTPAFAACNIDTAVYDDRDAHVKGGFTPTAINGKANWIMVANKFYSPTHSWYASNPDSLSQFVLTSGNFKPTGLSTLSFWHYVNTEYGYDGGLVELQSNGGNWIDAQPYFTKNGYNAVIERSNATLPKTSAFTGMPFATFSQSLIDLSSFTSDSLKVRFRMRADSGAGREGWYVDDITVANGCGAYQKIDLYNNSGSPVDSFKIPVYYTSAVLPVRLVDFTAIVEGTSALLQWQTATEVDTKEFIVEGSKDGTLYTTIGTAGAKGQSSNSYTLYDMNPHKGLNYYRIRIVDKDGSFTYSPVRSVLFINTGLIVVKPNPAVNSATVYFDSDIKLSYLTLTDMQGKLMKQVSAKNVTGSYTFNTAGLASGTYLIKVYPATGAPVTVKLIVNHR